MTDAVTSTPGSVPGYEYDITVIGGGPGGYEAAIRAAQLGKKTCLIESTYLGGTCLNVGCIPTKTLIKTATVVETLRKADQLGITGLDPAQIKVDMPRLQARKRAVVKTLVGGVRYLLRGNKVTLKEGTATFVDPHTVTVGEARVTSEYFLIATGSVVFLPPFIPCTGATHLLTSTEALDLEAVPPSITIIGGGVIGVEFAFLLNKLGSKVTVLELLPSILPMVDPEVALLAQKRLERDGVTFCLGAKVSRVQDDTVYYTLDGQDCSVTAQAVLMAVGRTPNTAGLGAQEIGLEFDRKAIKTDAGLRTNLPNIYAIGDVNGKAMLAHTASHEGIVAVENICGHCGAVNYEQIPSCIYLEPELACIGLTEPQARAQYGDGIRVGRFQMAGNGKSLVEGDTDGLFKVILAADSGKILGVHLYGQHTTDMISGISVAMAANATAADVLRAIHPHPTVSEALGEAFMAAWNGKAINSL